MLLQGFESVFEFYRIKIKIWVPDALSVSKIQVTVKAFSFGVW